MINRIDEKEISQKLVTVFGKVKVFHFSGARIEDLNH